MTSKTALVLLTALGLVAGCSSSHPTGSSDPVNLTHASLRRAQSCSDLTQSLHDDALSKMNRRIDAQIRMIREGRSYGGGVSYDGAARGGEVGAPAAAGASQNIPAAPSTSAPAHSDTETQVKGVDEADIVKTDGKRIYLLHGDKFLVVDAWPAAKLAMDSAIAIEGNPTEMFVADGRVVVFSSVDGTPIYAAAHVKPRPAYSDVYAPGGYVTGGVAQGAVAALPPAGPGGFPVGGGGFANTLTKITVLALDGSTASVTREMYFEGRYLTSRRVDANVRVVLNDGVHGPVIDYAPKLPDNARTTGPNGSVSYTPPDAATQIAAWEALREQNTAAINATTYADWMPSSFSKHGSSVSAEATRCEDYYVPTPGAAEFGLTQIESFDLNAPDSPPRGVAIVGAASNVYGNANALVLAGPAYVEPWVLTQQYAVSNGGSIADAAIPVSTLDYTNLHRFDLASDPTTALYTGSGTVPGSVKDQFAIDEKDGRVRVATTENRSGPPLADGKTNQVSHVFVLENAAGNLALVGDAGEIAPGEQLYATRFIGDKAYIVTWHVTDPLFVVDVADAHHPSVLGQVQIPGFSTYIHPLDDTHLLTIGRETDNTGHQHMGSYWYGIALQVFDVTNPLAPQQLHKFVFDGGEYATSEAMDNHKAFTYFDDKKLLAFPYVHQGSFGPSGPSSELEVFKVGVSEGISKVGAVNHAPLLQTLPGGNYGYCGGYFDGEVRRGLFIENMVYSVSYGGIIASDVAALDTPVSTLKLEAPKLEGVCK